MDTSTETPVEQEIVGGKGDVTGSVDLPSTERVAETGVIRVLERVSTETLVVAVSPRSTEEDLLIEPEEEGTSAVIEQHIVAVAQTEGAIPNAVRTVAETEQGGAEPNAECEFTDRCETGTQALPIIEPLKIPRCDCGKHRKQHRNGLQHVEPLQLRQQKPRPVVSRAGRRPGGETNVEVTAVHNSPVARERLKFPKVHDTGRGDKWHSGGPSEIPRNPKSSGEPRGLSPYAKYPKKVPKAKSQSKSHSQAKMGKSNRIEHFGENPIWHPPGCGCRCMKSGFGFQYKSCWYSSPQWGFGTSVRESSGKQYLSPEHAKSMSGAYSQGPVYKIYSSFGSQANSPNYTAAKYGFGTHGRNGRGGSNKAPGPGAYRASSAIGNQKESRRATSARAVFGTSSRDAQKKMYMDSELSKTYSGQDSPAPNVYTVKGSLGDQVSSAKRSAPGWGMGSSQRFKYDFIDRAKQLPGAGAYGHATACGKQNMSTKKTLPKYGFGTSTRDKLRKVFISPEHEKQTYGECSPGPGTGKAGSAFGSQNMSPKKSAPGWGFGTQRRIRSYYSDTPGPGSYCV